MPRRGAGDLIVGKIKETSFFIGYDISSYIYKGFIGFSEGIKKDGPTVLAGPILLGGVIAF